MTTPKKGFGLAPFGSSIFGYGSPALANPNIGKALATTTGVGEVRFINPKTKDYEMDPATGKLLGGTDTQQLVYLALVTVSNSSAVQSLGQGISKIKLITSNLQRQVENEVQLALRSLIIKNIISLDSVTVDRDRNNAVIIVVAWTDLAREQQFNLSVPVTQ